KKWVCGKHHFKGSWFFCLNSVRINFTIYRLFKNSYEFMANSIINPNKNKKGPKQSLTMVVVNSNQL
ncbi:hypothetical protein, partial [Lactiplantibacillus argentoratensis]|uniref:hypothetical protein n=1 Tax=Lactiplantibacillus argentoratensis TaxID=271881 RepID=UPI001B33315F